MTKRGLGFSVVFIAAGALTSVLFQNCSGMSAQGGSPASSGVVQSASQQPLTYEWTVNDWTTCSALCGGGEQSREVVCEKNDGTAVGDSLCSGTKPAMIQSCNVQACANYMWVQGGFGACSATCGGGQQTQSVVCQNSAGQTLADSFCSGTKPAATQACNTQACSVTPVPTTGASCALTDNAHIRACAGGPANQKVYGPGSPTATFGSAAVWREVDANTCAANCENFAKGSETRRWCSWSHTKLSGIQKRTCVLYTDVSCPTAEDVTPPGMIVIALASGDCQ